jgi:alkylation response protein AidB-like acyl-CoA dehydrogenase
MAKQTGAIKDPTVRQSLMKLYTLGELGKYLTLRIKAEKMAGREIAGAGNIGKLSMSEIVRQSRDLGLRIAGASGTLHAYTSDDRRDLDEATGNPALAAITEAALFAQAPPIYGGTDQVQRNILGERVLGLPKEPSNERITPWSQLPKNG